MNASAIPQGAKRQSLLIAVFGICLFSIFFAGLFQRVEEVKAVAPPSIITYQGKLLSSGDSVTTSQSMQFLIYDALSGGNLLYTAGGTTSSPSTISVTPNQGIFSVDLGGSSTNALPVNIFGQNTGLYLEVIVGGTTLTPRKQLTSAPYAINAQYLLGLAPDTGSTTAHIVQSDTNGNVTFNGDPQDSTVSGGVVYINPASPAANETLIGIANNGTEVFRVDAEGDTSIAGDATVTGTSTLNTTTINGDLTVDIGITVTSNTPLSTTSQKLYALGTTLYWSGQQVSLGGGLSWATTAVPTAGLTASGDSSGAGVGADGAGAVWLSGGSGLGVYASTTGAVGIGTSTLTSGSILSVAGTTTLRSLLPDTTLTYDIGSSALRFNNSYVGTLNVGTSSWQFAQSGADVLTITNTTATTVPALRFTSTNTAIFGGDLYTTSTNWYSGELLVGSSGGSTGITLNGDRITAWPSGSGGSVTGSLWTATSGYIYPTNPTSVNVLVGTSTEIASTTFQVAGTSYLNGTTTVSDLLEVKGKIENPVGYATLADGTGGVQLSSVRRFAIRGDIAYTASFSDNVLQSIDITDPSSPSAIDNGGTTSNPVDVALSGEYAYVAAIGDEQIDIFDIGNPSVLTLIDSITTPQNNPVGIEIVGNTAYVITSPDGTNSALLTYDITNPIQMEYLNLFDLSAATSTGSVFDIHVVGDYAYIAALQGMFVVDVSDRANPALVGGITSGSFTSGSSAIFVRGARAYVTTEGNSLVVVDVSDKTQPVELSSISHGGSVLLEAPQGLWVSGDYAFVAAGGTSDALTIIDISSSTNPAYVSEVADGAGGLTLDGPVGVYGVGNYIYVSAATSSAFNVINVAGVQSSNAQIGTAKIDNLQVLNNASFDDDVFISGGLTVGGSGLHVRGNVGFGGALNSSFNTTTLSFSNNVKFLSNSTNTVPFVFETQTFIASSTNNILFSLRNSSTTPIMSVSSNGDIRIAGGLFASSTTIGTPGNPGDLAEQVDVLPEETVAPGDVMMVDPTGRDRYRKATTAYSSPVAGVISTQPNIVIGDGKTDYKAHLALVGRVPVKFSTENGPANAGDLLVPASIPGYAMVYNPAIAPTSTNIHVIGIALEPANTQTKVMTLLQPSALTSRTQTDLSGIQSQIEALNSGLSEAEQTIVNNPTTQILTQVTSDLDLNNFALRNVKSINSESNRWRITEEGYLETTIEGTEAKLRTVHSNNTQALFSGEGQLENGLAIIAFNDDERAVVTRASSYHVLLTKTSAGNEQIQVTDKTSTGFVVEDVKGEGNATFDWVLLAGEIRVLGEQTEEESEDEISSTDTQDESDSADSEEIPTEEDSSANVQEESENEDSEEAQVEETPTTTEDVIEEETETPTPTSTPIEEPQEEDQESIENEPSPTSTPEVVAEDEVPSTNADSEDDQPEEQQEVVVEEDPLTDAQDESTNADSEEEQIEEQAAEQEEPTEDSIPGEPSDTDEPQPDPEPTE